MYQFPPDVTRKKDAPEPTPYCAGVPMVKVKCKACQEDFWKHPEDRDYTCSTSCGHFLDHYSTDDH